MKAKEATTNKGGGAEGLKDRLGGAAGHSRYLCEICKTPLTSTTQASAHHDAKHPGLEMKITDVHELHGFVTTQGVAVRGTTNSEKLKKKSDKADGSGK